MASAPSLFRSLSQAATVGNLLLSAVTSATPAAIPPPQHPPAIFEHGQIPPPPSTIQRAASPVPIDPAGVYLRATPLRPTTTDAAPGILVGYTAHSGTHTSLRVARSLDGARSWHRLADVWHVDRAAHDVDNAMPLQLPSGEVLYAFRNHDRDGVGGEYTRFRITVCVSDDGGRGWRFLSHVEDRAPEGGRQHTGLWEPFLRMGGDGRTVQAYYSSERGRAEQDNLVKVSRDGGRTWEGPVLVSRGGLGRLSRDGMAGVAEVDGRGTLICLFEGTESGRFSILRVISRDDGQTWGERGIVYTAGHGKNAGAPQVYNVGGVLVASFMTNEDAMELEELDGGQMKVVTSGDGGRVWSSGGGATVTADVGAHWPGLYKLDDRQFLALYSKDGIGAVSQVYRLV